VYSKASRAEWPDLTTGRRGVAGPTSHRASTERPSEIRWPTRLAVAQVDLALLAAQRGQPDEAALRGTAALDSGRVVASTLGWFAELDDLLLRDHSGLPEVQDFHERYAVIRRSARQSRG
jgi:hypothetical protein